MILHRTRTCGKRLEIQSNNSPREFDCSFVPNTNLQKSRDREVWRVVLPDRPFLRHLKSVPGTRIAYPWLECSELDVCECSFQTVGAPGRLLSWSLECPQIPRVRIAVLLLKYLLQIHENIDKFRFGLGILVERILEDNNFPNLAFLGMTKEFGKLTCYQVIVLRIRALFDVVLQSSRSLFVKDKVLFKKVC